MKTIKIFDVLFLAMTIVILSNCSLLDDSYSFTAKEKGENSFICYIDGKKFVPHVSGKYDIKISISYPIEIGFHKFDKKSLEIIARGDNIYLVFFIKNFDSIGEYKLNATNYPQINDTTTSNCVFSKWIIENSTFNHYKSISPHPSSIINITELSGDKMIMKGTFEMTLFNLYNLNDSIVIKNGKFDLNRKTLIGNK